MHTVSWMTTVFGKQLNMVVGIHRYFNRGYSGHLQRAQCESRGLAGLQINEWLGERARKYKRVKGAWAADSLGAPLVCHYRPCSPSPLSYLDIASRVCWC